MPAIEVTNKADSMIQVTPFDDIHKAPAPLDQISSTLPPGSFILANQTATPIHVVIVLWSYTDKNGTAQQKRFNCDGYVSGGVPTPIVMANDSTLITPGGCTMREYFAHMAAGKAMLGGGLLAARNKSVLDVADSLTAVRITIDSVIFADGKIWGPDIKQYHKSVSARYWAIRSVVEEVASAKAGGHDIQVAAEKIRAETEGKGDETSRLRNSYANSIRRSPNPEETLKAFSQLPPLPEFQHIGGETK